MPTLKMCKGGKIRVSGYLIFQNFLREYSSKKCADHWHGPGTWVGRLRHLASGGLSGTCCPLYFPEISGLISVSRPLGWNLLIPGAGVGDITCRTPSSGFCLHGTLSPVLFLSQSLPFLQVPLLAYPPNSPPSLTAPSFSPVELVLTC